MAHLRLDRRALLAGLGVAAIAGCATEPEPPGSRTTGAGEEPVAGGPERITYGDDPSQWVDVHTPDGDSRGLVVVIHGGFWKAEYGAEYGAPLAEDLVGRGGRRPTSSTAGSATAAASPRPSTTSTPRSPPSRPVRAAS